MALIFRPKGRLIWYIVDKSRKPSWIRLGQISHAEAKQVLRKYEADTNYLRLGLPLPPSKITLQELAAEYLQSIYGVKSSKTIQGEKSFFAILCAQFGNQLIHEITARQVEEFMASKGYKPNSYRLIVRSLKNAYQFAVERQYLPENPMLKIRTPRLGKSIPKFVDPKLLDSLISHMSGAVHAYYMILRYTGMRPGEALQLKVKNIQEITYTDQDTNKNRATPIILFKASKTAVDRAIPIHPHLFPIIQNLILNKKSEDYLFPNKNGEGHQRSMKMGLRRAMKKAGVEGISMYTFRHSVATAMLAKTRDMRAVQTVLGHASLTTTEIYAHALETAKVRAIEAL